MGEVKIGKYIKDKVKVVVTYDGIPVFEGSIDYLRLNADGATTTATIVAVKEPGTE